MGVITPQSRKTVKFRGPLAKIRGVTKTSQELRMLSSVTINCQVRMIVWIQVLNCQNCNQCLKCQLSSTVFPILKNESEKWGWKMRIKNEGQKWGSKMRIKNEGQKWGSKMRVKNGGQKWGSKMRVKMRVKNEGKKLGSKIWVKNDGKE